LWPGSGFVVRGDDPGQHIYVEGRGSVCPSTVYPADAPEDFADQGVFGWIRMATGLVSVSNGRESAVASRQPARRRRQGIRPRPDAALPARSPKGDSILLNIYADSGGVPTKGGEMTSGDAEVSVPRDLHPDDDMK
jgi:hypothetical protein